MIGRPNNASVAESRLKLLQERIFPQALNHDLISICPQLDLVATVFEQKQLDVFRFNGHRALSHKRTSATATVKAFRWSPIDRSSKRRGSCNPSHCTRRNADEPIDGDIAIIWSDAMVEILDIESGKSLTTYTASNASDPNQDITCFTWTRHLLDNDGMPSRSGEDECGESIDSSSIEDLLVTIDDHDSLSPKSSMMPTSAVTRFPQQLALLDLQHQLPNLSPLPHVDDRKIPDLPSATLFASQQTTDIYLQASRESGRLDNTVELSLACDSSRGVHISLYNGFEAGVHQLIDSIHQPDTRVILHASIAKSTTQTLLVRRDPASDSSLKFGEYRGTLSLDIISLDGIRRSGIFLEYMIRSSQRFTAIINYVLLTVACLRGAWSNCQEIPSRFINSIDETLVAQKVSMDFTQALYHIALTGSCPPAVREWLVETLGDRVSFVNLILPSLADDPSGL